MSRAGVGEIVTALLAAAAAAALAPPARAATPEAHAANRDMLLRAPFSPARASFFHAALDVPPLESARPLEAGTFLFRLRSTHARSNFKWTGRPGPKNTNFDGTYHEWTGFELAWGAFERLEVSARAVIAGWDEHQDRFNLFDDQGRPLVRYEDRKIFGLGATARHVNLSVVGVRVKGLLVRAEDAGYDLAVSGSLKFPIGRDRDLTHAGTTDVGAALSWRRPTGWGAWHASLGGVAPQGNENLFVESSEKDLNPFAHAAAGATWTVTDTVALGVQIETNSSAFREVDVLADEPVAIVGGVRKLLCDRILLEAAGGAGLIYRSTYQWMFHLSAAYAF